MPNGRDAHEREPLILGAAIFGGGVMNGCQRKLVKAVQTEFDRVQRDLKARVPAELLPINAAQNSLRTCIEAALQKTIPYDGIFLVELDIRLASYAISAAPMEDQEFLVSKFMQAFADAHMRRIAEGKVISTQWQMSDGRMQPNFPDGHA